MNYRITHGNHWDRDWSVHHSEYYSKAGNMSANLWQMPEIDTMQFQGDPLLRYQAWYLRVGMASVYIEGDYGEFLRAQIFEDDGYTPTGRKGARQVMHLKQHIFMRYEPFIITFVFSNVFFIAAGSA